MKVFELAESLELKLFAGADGLEKEITGGYSSDLLSDVMGHATAGQLWITIQTHMNVLAIASRKELSAIIIAKGLTPDHGTIEYGNLEKIAVLGTKDENFEITGKIYQLLRK
jgi:predicted transcriptional regulator